jgi:hydroxypyruvate isomerase
MIRLSLCIEPILPDLAIEERIRIAAGAGYKAVEFWDPSAHNLAAMSAAAASAGVSFAACTLNEPWTYRLNLPAAPVLSNIGKSIEMAESIGCPTLIGLSGDVISRADSQKNILTENLKRAADLLVKSGKTLVIEALNSYVDHKGYYLDSSAVALEIVKCGNCPNVKILFDVYHMQIMEGNITATMTQNAGWIGHVHTAGVPGRQEILSNEVNYRYVLNRFDQAGYDRFIGLEYWPSYDHRRSIKDSLAYVMGT